MPGHKAVIPEIPIFDEASELRAEDLTEARHYLPKACESELEIFARRQLRARRRLTLMRAFYHHHPCRLARLHLLAGCAIALGRFAGFSASYDRLGEAFMPVDSDGNPRTEGWKIYAEACAMRRPLEVRDELWLAAHMKDLEAVKLARLDAAFYEEMGERENDPTWRLLRQHMEVTIGARLMDGAALSGAVAYETAFGASLAVTVKRLFTAGWALLGRYAVEGVRAVLTFKKESRRHLINYPRTAFALLRYSLTVWRASKVFRRGVRARERGSLASFEGWNLLEEVIGDRLQAVHPMIVDFYTNPSRYQVKAALDLKTLPAKFWSRVATLLIGQGLYESDKEAIDARFRIFRRRDGSMHFVRELYCGDKMRVFDSDFIVRQMQGKPALFEVFVDLKVDVEMAVQPIENGGLSIRGKNIYFRGVRLPQTGIKVEFQSRVVTVDGIEQLNIDGQLLMQPQTRWGKFLAYKVLRRPEHLACIHYTATPITSN
ncbi:MAG: hypothetical protein AB1757_30135 [Acidobacteriota bacterium]